MNGGDITLTGSSTHILYDRIRHIGSVVSQQIGQANVNGTKLSQMPIPLPPLAEQSLAQAERLRQSILKKAFEYRLVAQDPNDEPAGCCWRR